MITDVISPAAFASTEATHTTNPQLKALPSDYAITLRPHLRTRLVNQHPDGWPKPFMGTGRRTRQRRHRSAIEACPYPALRSLSGIIRARSVRRLMTCARLW